MASLAFKRINKERMAALVAELEQGGATESHPYKMMTMILQSPIWRVRVALGDATIALAKLWLDHVAKRIQRQWPITVWHSIFSFGRRIAE